MMEKIARVTATLYSGPADCKEVVGRALVAEVGQWLRDHYPEAIVEVVHDTTETDVPGYLVTAEVEKADGEVVDSADVGLDHDLFDAIWGDPDLYARACKTAGERD